MKLLKPVIKALFCAILSTSFVYAGETATASQKQPSPDAPSVNIPVVKYGFEERFRWESWNNVDGTSLVADRRNQARFRTKMWTELPLGTNGQFYFQLNNEFKKQVTRDVDLDPDEGVVESAYVNWTALGVKGLSLKAGRQNLLRGDGLIFMDGTPLDGSRTFYFNALNLSYSARKSTLEIIGLLNPRQDRFFPQINDKHKYLLEWDEQAVGAYFTTKPRKTTDLQTYYFYKKETHDYRAPSNAQFQPDRHVHTVGARLDQSFARNVQWITEAAFQRGAQHPTTEVRGWAFTSTVKKTFKAARKPYVLAGVHALAGDDPKTTAVEGWDPMFGRFPHWSDLFLYAFVKEKGVGYWTNVKMVQFEAGAQVLPKLKVRATYYRVGAFHPFAGAADIFAGGTHRGDLFQARADFTLTPSVSGHFQVETLLPGDFYTRRDRGSFARAEIIYSFHGLLKPGASR